MKLPRHVVLLGLSVVSLGLIAAGWQLGTLTKLSVDSTKPAKTKPFSTTVVELQNPVQLPPFEISEDPPYGPAIPPEEMKPLPRPEEAAAYLKVLPPPETSSLSPPMEIEGN